MLAILQAYADFRKENDDVGKSFLFLLMRQSSTCILLLKEN